MFPDADLFTLFAVPEAIPDSLQGRRMHSSFLNRIPAIGTVFHACVPLFPYATESLDLRGYDLVISSEWRSIKGVLIDQNAVQICYCHTPWRQLYDQYFPALKHATPWPLRSAYAWVANRQRQWDFIAAQRVDKFIANSRYIQERIFKCYRRDSEVIYPPVDTTGFLSPNIEDYYLSVGGLYRPKRLDIVIGACNRLKRRLLIAGSGREEKRLKAIAGPTIEFLGRVADAELPGLYAKCRAFLFAADEDFGIAPVEAQAFGRPVIAYGHGGSLETVRAGDSAGRSDTGVFFTEQTVESLMAGVRRFEGKENSFVPEEIQRHAKQFDTSVFITKLRQFVDSTMSRKEK
jgi:glycosyltransferase involved in cell wall biosynthesis